MLEAPDNFWYNRKYLLEKRKYMTQIIDGKALAAKLQGQLAEKTAKLKEETGLVPGLVVILVGDNPASQVYVRKQGTLSNCSRFPYVKSFVFLRPLPKKNCWI